jgi:hypothetical protein
MDRRNSKSPKLWLCSEGLSPASPEANLNWPLAVSIGLFGSHEQIIGVIEQVQGRR